MSRFQVMDNLRDPASPVQRGFRSWLVDLLTVGVALLALVGAVAAGSGGAEVLLGWMMVAAVLDGLDGPLARRWGVASEAGRRLDLMVDWVAFVLCPAVVLVDQEVGLWLAVLLVVGGAGRLVRAWGTRRLSPEFEGLAFPAAGLAVAASMGIGAEGIIVPAVAVGMVLPVSMRRLAGLGGVRLVVIAVVAGMAAASAQEQVLHAGVLGGAIAYGVVGITLRRSRG
ncbi:MAG: CDP-alcohol phosphatidyltransferase family protein [Phycisphaeraceae bacterium]